MPLADESSSDLSEATSARVQQVVYRFEAAYEGGPRPEIDAYLPAQADERRAALVHLVHIDLERRLKAGEAARVEDYLERYPELAHDPAVILDLVAAEYRQRRRREPQVTATDYLERFPQLAGQLRPLLEATPPEGPISCPPAGELPAVPGYEVLRELGRGGMGVVYQARHVQLNRLVALKMVLRADLAGPQALVRFLFEAEVAARVQHANVVQIFEVGTHGRLPYFALEYVDGGTLADRLAGRPWPPRRAAELVQTLARATHVAHLQGIIHRDLKPANVLLTAGGTPKIGDFGLATQYGAEAGLTPTGDILGTPGYMSPEQASGRRQAVGPATDVYALGVILYELLTGAVPFTGATYLDILRQVVGTAPPRPSSRGRRLDRDLETVCLKCLEKEPQRRYQSAEALADDLGRYLADEPIAARPVGPTGRAWRWARRNPGWAAMLAAVAGLLLVIAVGSPVMIVRLNQALEASEGQRLRAEEAQRQAQEQQRQADARRRESELLSTRLLMEQGLALCEQGEYGRGLLWLVRGLESAPDDAPELRRSLRTLLGGWSTQLHPLKAALLHRGAVFSAAFSPDGKALLTATGSVATLPFTGEARLWEASTGRALGEPFPHPHVVTAVAFSPDGRTVLTGSGDHTARLWEAGTGKPLSAPLPLDGWVRVVAFSPDGRTVLTGGGDSNKPKGEARLWEAATGKPIGEVLRHEGQVSAVAFSPDGRFVLTGSYDKTARLWHAATGRPAGEPLRHQDTVDAVAFSPDGKLVLTGSGDKTAQLWEAATGRPAGERLQHPNRVYAVAFSRDGKTVLTGAQREARRWEAATGKPIGAPLRHEGSVVHVAYSPDGRMILTQSNVTRSNANNPGEARLWDAATGRPIGEPLRHQGPVLAAAFSPDGRAVLTGGSDGTARLWEVTARDRVVEFLRPGYPAGGVVAFSPDGRLVLTTYDKEAPAVGRGHGPAGRRAAAPR
jgi:WD40 repeat protein